MHLLQPSRKGVDEVFSDRYFNASRRFRFAQFHTTIVLNLKIKHYRMKRSLLIALCCWFVFAAVSARPVLPEILSDNLVLQQNTSVALWGKAEAGRTIEVKPSWNGKTYRSKTDNRGNWLMKIETPEATFEPQSIVISDGESVTLDNVLIGEVWIASGQSNMEMPLNGFSNNPIKDANATIALSSQNKGIRFVTIPKTGAFEPQETVKGTWKVCNSENSPEFSATAYHFAATLSNSLNVPVGIISCSWGGSRVESWINREVLETYPDIDLSEKGLQAVENWKRPMVMYNGMFKPLTNYTIKGFIWYQGESNVGLHDTYAQRLADMVKIWREDRKSDDLPFYYVEIAPWIYGDGEMGINGALLREAQFKAQFLIPNSGMISSNDLVEEYEKTNIHPRNKIDVGKRLAYMALNKTYRLKNIAAHGPEYKSMEVKEGKIFLSFNHAEGGFNRESGINGFEIAGEDRIFHPALAKVDLWNRQVVVSSDKVPNPIAVRYCFRNFLIGNLYNTRELPVVPFRTDNF